MHCKKSTPSYLMTSFGNNFEDEGDMFKHKTSKAEKEISERLIEYLNKDLKQAKIRDGEEGYDEEYKNEEDFTINAVIPWLKTRKEYGDIEYTGGNDEYGRDIVFSKTEIGNRKMWWAIQVKNDDIKGTHKKSNASIQEIINQLKSAMTMPYTRKGETAKITIQGLMVVTLGKITKNAAELIKNSDDLKGRTILFFGYSDILQNLKESPMNVSIIKYLIRLKRSNEASCKGLKKELEETKLKYQWNIYNNEPREDMFELKTDDYVDLSFDSFFEDIQNNSIWKKIENSIKKSGFNLTSINLRIYYPKVFGIKELEKAKRRFFKDALIKIHEDISGPCFIYNCNNFKFHKEEWLQNVNNMQILQKN